MKNTYNSLVDNLISQLNKTKDFNKLPRILVETLLDLNKQIKFICRDCGNLGKESKALEDTYVEYLDLGSKPGDRGNTLSKTGFPSVNLAVATGESSFSLT